MVNLDKYEHGEIFSPLQRDLITLLEQKGRPMTRQEIYKELHKASSTIHDNLSGLMDHKLIQKFNKPSKNPGRPWVFFTLQESN